jgi:hypothetical protein
MSHQDWKPIILKEKPPVPIKTIVEKEKPKSGSMFKFNINGGGVKIGIEDSGEETVKIKTVPIITSKLIVCERLRKKLTRKQLANQLNLKETVIADIETGKAIYDGNQIALIKKYLQIT